VVAQEAEQRPVVDVRHGLAVGVGLEAGLEVEAAHTFVPWESASSLKARTVWVLSGTF